MYLLYVFGFNYDCAFMKSTHFYGIQFIQSLARGQMGERVIIQATIWFATKCLVFTLRVFVVARVDEEHIDDVPSLK